MPMALGLIQLLAALFRVRGLSAAGGKFWLSALIGLALLGMGTALAWGQPFGALALGWLMALAPAIVISVIAGSIAGWKDLLGLASNSQPQFPNPQPLTPSHSDFFVPPNWSGDCVILICGAGDTRTAFKWVLFRALMDNGLAVFTYDPPGHGENRGLPMTVSNAQAAAQAALNWACAQPGVRRIGVVGISFGGSQAAWLAAHDARARALALICAPTRLPPVTRKIILKEALGLLLPRNLVLLKEHSLLAYWREWQSMPPAWYGRSLYEMIDEFDITTSAKAIGQTPLLVVHGEKDFAVPPSCAREIYASAEPERELVWSPQATHMSLILRQREMRHLASWMAQALKKN